MRCEHGFAKLDASNSQTRSGLTLNTGSAVIYRSKQSHCVKPDHLRKWLAPRRRLIHGYIALALCCLPAHEPCVASSATRSRHNARARPVSSPTRSDA